MHKTRTSWNKKVFLFEFPASTVHSEWNRPSSTGLGAETVCLHWFQFMFFQTSNWERGLQFGEWGKWLLRTSLLSIAVISRAYTFPIHAFIRISEEAPISGLILSQGLQIRYLREFTQADNLRLKKSHKSGKSMIWRSKLLQNHHIFHDSR